MSGLLKFFPRTRFVDENDIVDQLRHVRSESNEAMDAFVDNESAVRIAEELIDTMGSSVSGLRILAEKHGVDVAAVHDYVIEKNRVRGYYS